MPLIPCHECSTHVSDHARICPKCGAPVIATIKRRQKAALIDLGLRAGFALIFIIIFWVMFHRMTQKTLAPLKEMKQQLQQQQKGAASPPMVVNFQPPPVQPPPEPAWGRQIKLGGISGTPDHRFAIINGKMFETGDVTTVKITGKGVTIHCLEIGESSVSISIDGIDGTRVLQLPGN
jgi:hypothetical protein